MDTGAGDAQLGRRARKVLRDVRIAITGRDREAQARIGAQRDAALAREESVPEAGSAQEPTFQEIGAFRHEPSFMRPAGPVMQVSIAESGLCRSNLDLKPRPRSPCS